jgi:FtsP/CotA-like multicopper oxidase with cupredoxin domain
MIFANILLILILLKNACAESFSNIVEYPTKSDDNIYRFYLEVSQGLSMAYWNSTRETYQVVVKQNGTFYLRDRRSSTSCGAVSKLDDSLADTIVKAAGLHKEMFMVNRMFPGTPIVVPVNSIVRVKVKNMMMTDTLSIHWHGLSQYNTFYMDGVSRVTQCPIGPGDSFTYEFQVTELGTHWYHAHSGEQRMDGVYGPLIVTSTFKDGSIVNPDVTPPFKYEKEFFFHVQEWFQNKASSIVQTIIWEDLKYLYGFDEMNKCLESTYTDDGTPSIMFPFVRETDTIVINGKVFN